MVAVSWREQPTQHEIEALGDNIRRVGMVIRFRWVLVAALAAFSVLAGVIYSVGNAIPHEVLLTNMSIPAVALVFVLGYNTYYQLTYRRLGNIAFLNHAQLLFDALVISVLVHYSGGVYSWFDAMYALIVLEAAFIFSRPRDTWIVGTWAALAYGSVLLLEYVGILQHVTMPLVGNDLQLQASYVLVRYLWTVTVVVGTAGLSQVMMSVLRRREAELADEAAVDETTGLRDRRYFQHRLIAELQRARSFGRGLAVLMVDIDHFDDFNKTFGLDAGNEMLRAVGQTLAARMRELPDSPIPELNTVSRFGGEEFAILMPESSAESRSGLGPTDAVRLTAEGLRCAVGDLRMRDMGVTVSVGVALYPEDGRSSNDLLAAADQALFAALVAGGNRVATAADAPPGSAEGQAVADSFKDGAPA
jgi:diguanylate cyclase (GGDEF)-like protein